MIMVMRKTACRSSNIKSWSGGRAWSKSTTYLALSASWGTSQRQYFMFTDSWSESARQGDAQCSVMRRGLRFSRRSNSWL